MPFDQPVYIDAEFTEEVEEQEATGEITVPDYELVTDERDRTFEGTTPKLNNSTFTSTAATEIISGLNYLGFRHHAYNSHNAGINTVPSRAKWLENISSDQVFKIRFKLRAYNPSGNNFSFRVLGVTPCSQNGHVQNIYPNSRSTNEFGGVNNDNFAIYDYKSRYGSGVNMSETSFFKLQVNTNFPRFAVGFHGTVPIGSSMEFDYIQLIPANEQYYEEIAITDNIPYQPPSVTHPRLELGILGSQNLINPHSNVSLNNIHKIEILDSKENIYYEETITGLPSLTREILLNPYSLPLNEELTLKFTAINQDNEVNYFLTNEKSDIVNFMWRDETGNLNEILELGQEIIDDYKFYNDVSFNGLIPTDAQIQQYDLNGDNNITVQDFLAFTDNVMDLIESLGLSEIIENLEV